MYFLAAANIISSELVEKTSGKVLHSATRYLQIRGVVVSDKIRLHHNITKPLDEKTNLFYYPDKAKRNIIKKFNMHLHNDIEIYWIGNGNPMCKKLSEIKKENAI